jgi:hypothetical protein
MKNFGKIKNIFNTMLSESMGSKDANKRDAFKNYLKMLKENEILKAQFNVYTSIESLIENDQFKASEKIKGNIDLLESYDRKDILKANTDLFKLTNGRTVKGSYVNDKLHENISNMIFSKDINRFVDSLNETIEYAKSNSYVRVNEGIGIPNKIFAPLVIDRFNHKYNDLTKSQIHTLKIILENNEVSNIDLFSQAVKECLELVDNKLKNSNTDLKESLLAVKENLLSREYIKESFDKDIFKILDLKEDLM